MLGCKSSWGKITLYIGQFFAYYRILLSTPVQGHNRSHTTVLLLSTKVVSSTGKFHVSGSNDMNRHVTLLSNRKDSCRHWSSNMADERIPWCPLCERNHKETRITFHSSVSLRVGTPPPKTITSHCHKRNPHFRNSASIPQKVWTLPEPTLWACSDTSNTSLLRV